MYAMFFPLIIRILTLGLDWIFAKQAAKAALEKKIAEKLAGLEQSTKDSVTLREGYNSARAELDKPPEGEAK